MSNFWWWIDPVPDTDFGSVSISLTIVEYWILRDLLAFSYRHRPIFIDKRNASMCFVWYKVCCKCIGSVTDISATVTLIGVKFCMMVDMGPGHKVSQKWPKKSQSLTANISKTVNRSVTCQLELKISSMRAFQKCIKWDGSFPGESPIKKNMYFFYPGTDISRRSAWKCVWW